jgi:hypothetical protein
MAKPLIPRGSFPLLARIYVSRKVKRSEELGTHTTCLDDPDETSSEMDNLADLSYKTEKPHPMWSKANMS